MFIDIGVRIKEIESCVVVVEARVKEIETDLPNVSCISRKSSMQLSRKAGKALISAYKNEIKELQKFISPSVKYGK